MALNITLTPGKVFSSSERLETPKLNLLGSPTAVIDGTLSTAEIDDGAVTADKTKCGPHFYATTCAFSTDTYTLTFSPTDRAPATSPIAVGTVVVFRADSTNAGNTYVKIGAGGTAFRVDRPQGSNLIPGDIQADAFVEIRYDGTVWQLLTVPEASHLITAGVLQYIVAYSDPATITKIWVAPQDLILTDAAGASMLVHDCGNLSIEATSTGAGGVLGTLTNATWYGIWIISDGTTVAAVACTALTYAGLAAIGFPVGYTYAALVGMAYYQQSTDRWWRFAQTGDEVAIQPVTVVLAVPNTDWVVIPAGATSLTAFQAAVPENASMVSGWIGVDSDAACRVAVAAVKSDGSLASNPVGEQYLTGRSNAVAAFNGIWAGGPFRVICRGGGSRNLQYKCGAATSPTYKMVITGFTLNI